MILIIALVDENKVLITPLVDCESHRWISDQRIMWIIRSGASGEIV